MQSKRKTVEAHTGEKKTLSKVPPRKVQVQKKPAATIPPMDYPMQHAPMDRKDNVEIGEIRFTRTPARSGRSKSSMRKKSSPPFDHLFFRVDRELGVQWRRLAGRKLPSSDPRRRDEIK